MRRLKRRPWFVLAILFGVDAAVGVALVAFGATVVAPDAPEQPRPDPYTVKVNALVDDHDCWTGPAPSQLLGDLPGHVVVTLPNGQPIYGGEKMVGMALEQAFDGVDHGLRIHGFCR